MPSALFWLNASLRVKFPRVDTLIDVTSPSKDTFNPSSNHDPDADSSGTSITLTKP